MTHLRRVLAYFAVATIVASACSAPQVTTSDQRASLERIRQEIEEAENSGSVERMRVHFADDVVMMAPNMAAVAGADSAAQVMRQFFEAFNIQIQYTSTEIVVSGDWAFDRGTYSQTLTPKQGAALVKESGKYLWVYRRAADGSWKHSRVIWNTSDPLPDSRA